MARQAHGLAWLAPAIWAMNVVYAWAVASAAQRGAPIMVAPGVSPAATGLCAMAAGIFALHRILVWGRRWGVVAVG